MVDNCWVKSQSEEEHDSLMFNKTSGLRMPEFDDKLYDNKEMLNKINKLLIEKYSMK